MIVLTQKNKELLKELYIKGHLVESDLLRIYSSVPSGMNACKHLELNHLLSISQEGTNFLIIKPIYDVEAKQSIQSQGDELLSFEWNCAVQNIDLVIRIHPAQNKL